jgi:hypothetical protein
MSIETVRTIFSTDGQSWVSSLDVPAWGLVDILDYLYQESFRDSEASSRICQFLYPSTHADRYLI